MSHPDFTTDMLPPAPQPVKEPERRRREPEPEPGFRESGAGGSSFSKALARIERHRPWVQWTLVVALLARLVFDFRILQLAMHEGAVEEALPQIGVAVLSYLLVLWFLAVKSRDRVAFGMAIGIGVIEGVYAAWMAWNIRPFHITTTGPWAALAVSHIAFAIPALLVSRAYPPNDTKRPWLIGFVAAVILLLVPAFEPMIEGAIR
ncbi:MAG TPA: hypothetical protein VGD77_18220 [Gemmatimonadaceae bacterium]